MKLFATTGMGIAGKGRQYRMHYSRMHLLDTKTGMPAGVTKYSDNFSV